MSVHGLIWSNEKPGFSKENARAYSNASLARLQIQLEMPCIVLRDPRAHLFWIFPYENKTLINEEERCGWRLLLSLSLCLSHTLWRQLGIFPHSSRSLWVAERPVH